MKKNIIINGKITSGKTTKIYEYVDEAIKQGDNLVFFDSKEEYLEKYQNELKEKNYNTIILNLKEPLKSDSFNPLLYPYHEYKKGNKDKAIEILENMGNILFYERNSDKFWSNSACNVFIGLCIAIFEDAKEEEINFSSIWSMMTACETKYALSDYATRYVKLKGEEDINNTAYKYLLATFLAPKETKGGILATARSKFSNIITRENLNIMLSFEDLKIEDNKKYSIFIIQNNNNKELSSIILGRVIEQINTGIIVLDNFDDIDCFNYLKEYMSNGPSESKYYIIGTRDINNLYNNYSEYLEKLATIINLDNEYEYKKIDKNKIEFPTLEKKNIKIFNLINYVDNKLTDENGVEEKDIEINSIMKQIEEKLNQLEEEDNKATSNK
ncbi:MAG: hypothetical protein E7158_06070 [Firmicutes bacterium]|nr:hypothetical protein [Bacillota bacterium]